MPLPKPPASKATLLSATDYETQAAARTANRSLQPTHDASKEPLALTNAAAAAAAPRLETRPTAVPKPGTATADIPAAKPRARSSAPKRMFVLDTNVLMHDPMSLFSCEAHAA